MRRAELFVVWLDPPFHRPKRSPLINLRAVSLSEVEAMGRTVATTDPRLAEAVAFERGFHVMVGVEAAAGRRAPAKAGE